MTSAQARMEARAAARELPGVYRAIVSLSDALTSRDRPLEERIVFFEADPPRRAHETLTELLRTVWRVDTTDWVRDGLIYNVCSAVELIGERAAEGLPPVHALFERASGGDGSDPLMVDRVRYARLHEVDLFVRPQAYQALLRVIREIDARYDAAARARAAADAL
jgi:hypothetical protein